MESDPETGAMMDAKRQMEERERLHLEWLAYLAHDLGTPLARVIKRLEVIEYDDQLSQKGKNQLIQAIHVEITQLAETIGSLSRFASLESGLERTFENADIVPILQYAVDVFECEASKKGIELDLRVVGELGWVRMETSLIRRAIENLLANGIRHTPDGGLVSVSAELIEGMICIRVADSGPGIRAEELEKIFEFAFRGTGQTRIARVGSAGLGLALVRKVTELHNGNVRAHNRDPHGAEFVISLPGLKSNLSCGNRPPVCA
jgi:signal transduction histidine kinase